MRKVQSILETYYWYIPSRNVNKKSAWSTEERDVLLAQFTNTSTWWLVEFSQRPQGKSTAPTQNLYLAHLMLLSNCVTLTAHGFHGTKTSLQHHNKDRVFTLTTTNSFIHSFPRDLWTLKNLQNFECASQ
jgi:hypothetical protein